MKNKYPQLVIDWKKSILYRLLPQWKQKSVSSNKKYIYFICWLGFHYGEKLRPRS